MDPLDTRDSRERRETLETSGRGYVHLQFYLLIDSLELGVHLLFLFRASAERMVILDTLDPRDPRENP